ncbi:MAG: hypothetical protein ACRCX2_31700 [Paraclostridium sp.]
MFKKSLRNIAQVAIDEVAAVASEKIGTGRPHKVTTNKEEYMINLDIINEEIDNILNENQPIEAMLQSGNFGEALISTHFIAVAKPYKKRIRDEDLPVFKEVLVPRGKINRDDKFERVMCIHKNAGIVANLIDRYDPNIIDTMIRTERLNAVTRGFEKMYQENGINVGEDTPYFLTGNTTERTENLVKFVDEISDIWNDEE